MSASGPTRTSVKTDASGHFAITGIGSGQYTLSAALDGYQSAQSDIIPIGTGASAGITLTLQRVTGTSGVRVIGRTTSRRTEALQAASVIYRSTDVQSAVTDQGFYRVGDALRLLPGVNEAGAETAAPSDDLTLSIRGIGALETLTVIDGHPIGYGLKSSYNYEISPAAPFRGVQTIYGSGADAFFPVNALGGVFNLQTLEPTRQRQVAFTQQYGTFDTVGSTLQATGSFGKIGYALGLGSQGVDGPFRHINLYNSTASLDQSSPGYYHDTGTYDVDTSANNKSFLGKLRFDLAPSTNLTVSALGIRTYNDKTGNGDNDYLPYEVALAQAGGNTGANYNVTDGNGQPICFDTTAGTVLGSTPGGCGSGQAQLQAACPNNLVPSVNVNGVPNGTLTNHGPNKGIGQPGAVSSQYGPGMTPVAYGGSTSAPCLTPQQWAGVNYGWQGAGPAYQRYNVGAYNARLSSTRGNGTFALDLYSTRYQHHYDRSNQLPFLVNPDGSESVNFFSYDESVINSGLIASETFNTERASTGLGIYLNNTAYQHRGNGAENATAFANESAFFLREAYTFGSSPLTAFANVWYKTSTVTNTQYVDPRLSLVYNKGNNVYRLGFGSTTTQPSLADLNSPFSPNAPGSLLGATCTPTSPCSIGSAGSAGNLRPERGIDTEIAVGHRFAGNSQIQLTLYNTNIYNKLYGFTAPLTTTGLGGIPPGTAGTYTGFVPNCSAPLACLGLTADVNVAQVRARGIEINGQQQLIKHFTADYEYGTESTVLVSADASLLASQGNLRPASQLPYVPLHKYNAGLAYEFKHDTTLHLGYHHVSENNPKNLPAYGYADLKLESRIGPGRFAIGVNNLFSSQADYRGLISEGVPLATNSYAKFKPAPQERFQLPFRSITFTYGIQLH
ncbi:MAG: hypothetical protein NVSMB64_13710 [Candidatus Velthaea sp.]